MKRFLQFNKHEKQSNLNRIKNAELLILQLPENHDGRNTWLLNYGIGEEATEKREKRKLKWIPKLDSCETIG